jgi:hypothetical protein
MTRPSHATGTSLAIIAIRTGSPTGWWNILLDGDVNTLPFRNIGGTAPFLWGGFLPTLFDFSREVLNLVGAEATGAEMQMLTRYMQSVTAPPNPYTLPGGRLTEDAIAGRSVFEAPAGIGGAGCGTCHSGPLFTNTQSGKGKTEGLSTDTPSLIGVYDTGPWGRQGQWESLEAMVAYAVEFTGGDLSADELSQVIDYVYQLPGDRLYVTGAQPLNNAVHVWNETPVEVAFSGALGEGQESYFRLLEHGAGGDSQEVLGTWKISGRYARFEGPTLALDSSYSVEVDSGLTGTLGETFPIDTVMSFKTGKLPAFDLSGSWEWQIQGPIDGTVVVAYIQGTGGQLSGVVLDGGGLIEVDHVEGFVAGEQMFIDPFLVNSPLGELLVQGAQALCTDTDGDGYADSGSGAVNTAFGDFDLTLVRLTQPE